MFIVHTRVKKITRIACSICLYFLKNFTGNGSARNFHISEKCKFQKVGFSALVAKIGLGLTWCLQVSVSPFHM